jgi:hypothetical protein
MLFESFERRAFARREIRIALHDRYAGFSDGFSTAEVGQCGG